MNLKPMPPFDIWNDPEIWLTKDMGVNLACGMYVDLEGHWHYGYVFS